MLNCRFPDYQIPHHQIAQLPNYQMTFDDCDPFRHAAWLDRNELEAEIPVGLLVNPLEAQRVLEADSPCCGRRDEAKVADEEDTAFVDAFLPDALQLARQKR